jgi:peptide/nickel transport system ATP-binding protein
MNGAPRKSAPSLLEVRDLRVTFRRDGEESEVVRGIDLDIPSGGRVALVGESGCGKSMTCLSLARLAPTDRAHLSGSIRFQGRELMGADASTLRSIRGSGIAYVFQDPSGSLNPVMRVGSQIAECLRDLPRNRRNRRVLELLERVRLPDPATTARTFPCELSGGQQQRVVLAMALAARPRLLVADEPTTALDVVTQAQVLDLVDELADAEGMAVLLVTHNLGLVAGRTRHTFVLYGGQVVEHGPTRDVLSAPRHPYTAGLLASVPRLDAPRGAALHDIPGTVPSADALPPGCTFAPRCPHATPACSAHAPPLRADADGRAVRCFR